jgi:hypothetical protein
MLTPYSNIISVQTSCIDPDAQAFITAAETAGASFTTAQKGYIDRLVKNWKGAGDINSTTNFWTATNRLHVYLGAASSPMAINVKTATSTFTFNGGWTFASTGATPNGSNGYIDTSVNTSTINTSLSTGICAISAYNTNTAVNGFEGYLLGADTYFYFAAKFSDNNMYYRNYNSVEGDISQSGVDTRNIYMRRIASGNGSITRAKSTIVTQNPNLTPTTSGVEYLSALNFLGTPIGFDTKERNFDALILGMDIDNTKRDLLIDIINAFQTDFGRNNYQP